MNMHIVALAAAFALVGIAAVGAADPLATIPDEAGVLGGDLYVNEDATVWQETNGCEGLQTEATDDCDADTQLA